jgi:hypothetical protein
MDNENKIVVVAKDGKIDATVLTGRAAVELEDKSQPSFIADTIKTFVEYVNSVSSEGAVFSSSGRCELCGISTDRYAIPIAVVKYDQTGFITKIGEMNNVELSIESLEARLKPLLSFGNADVIKLYQFTRNCNIQSYSEYRRQIDEEGNYSFLCSRQNKPDTKVRPVDKIVFTVPVLRNHDDKASFSFDVAISFKEDGKKVFVTLTNFTFEDEVKDSIILIVGKYMEQITNRKVYGGVFQIVQKDTSWKYKTM